jgi:methionyl-tRNA synthetase
VARDANVDPDGKVLYVWFDAPIGYISATKEWAVSQEDPDRWKQYWQDSDTRLLHFIGKDNIVFHCLIFPAMLMAHGDYVLPDNVPANEFMNLEGKKLSTSRNWAVWLDEYLEDFEPDPLRYALATMLPETKDADFSWAEFQNRVNSELADVLGNFVNRTLSFTNRFFEGRVPPLTDPKGVDLDVLASLSEYPDRIGQSYDTFRFREAVFETVGLARLGNKYFNDTEPWNTAKTDSDACGNTIHVCLQLCASLCVLMKPVMPDTSERLARMLRLKDVRSSEPGADLQTGIGWSDAGLSLLETGHRIGEAEILFVKVEDDVIQEQVDKLGTPTDAPDRPEPVEPFKPTIAFEDFQKLDLRVGRVRSAERVKGTDKLLLLKVDLGSEDRQVVAGLAGQVDVDSLVGRHVILVVNLAPRKIRGLESQGMLLAAEDAGGSLSLLDTDSPPGSIVR